jgi:hypothetical protein
VVDVGEIEKRDSKREGERYREEGGRERMCQCDKIFGGMEPTEMDIMTVWRLIYYEIAVQPN